MTAKLKHVAIVSDDYAVEGRFYQALFGMESFANARPDSAVAITDGYVGMNVNPRRPGRQAGLDHFGFEVDDVEGIFERAGAFPLSSYVYRPGNRPFAGITMNDPAGNIFDLSKRGMENRKDVYVEMEKSLDVHPRHVKHIALRVLDADLIARFYTEVIGLLEAEHAPDDSSVYLTDGHVGLVIQPWKITDFEGTGICRPAPDHIGFAVEDLDAFKADVERIGDRNEHIAAREIGRGKEGQVRLELLRQCRYGEMQISDPDGVLLDIQAV